MNTPRISDDQLSNRVAQAERELVASGSYFIADELALDLHDARIEITRLAALVETLTKERDGALDLVARRDGELSMLSRDMRDSVNDLIEERDAHSAERDEEALLADRYEGRLAEAYQAKGALISAMGLSDNADCIRIQDVLAYGKTEDGIDLLPWPKDRDALLADRAVVSGHVPIFSPTLEDFMRPTLTQPVADQTKSIDDARAVGRAEGMEEAAKIADTFKSYTGFGPEIAVAIRAAAKETGR